MFKRNEIKKVIAASALFCALCLSACSAPLPAPTPFPTLPPLPLTLVANAPTTATATLSPAVPAATISATPTSQVTANPKLSPTPSRAASLSSVPSPSASPSSSPTSNASSFPPGVYVNELRTDPNPPTRTAELKFYATFINAMGSPQNYRWIVYIYRFDTPGRSTGESTLTQVALPNGTTEQKSDGFWRLGPGNQCESFFARVAWLDQDKRPTMFVRPDGKIFEKSMTLCP